MPSTPYLRVDVARLDANIARVAAAARAAGVALRPHAKTHKSTDVGARQLAAGAVGLTVATIAEAEVFARADCDDLFVALPLWPDDDRSARLRELAGQVRLRLGVDSAEGAAHLSACLAGAPVGVLVEVDSGHHRSGVAPDRVAAVATAARASGLRVEGLFTFPGHSYTPAGQAAAALDEERALSKAATALRSVGIEPGVVSGGSTPSLQAALRSSGGDRSGDIAVVNELRPGVYVFGDAQQWELGSMLPDQIALTCRATVISHAGGRVVLDAGSKALGADRAPWSTGFGRLLHDWAARIVMLSEHHSIVETSTFYPLGSVLDVVPNHVCNAVNLADQLYAERGGVVERWPVTARGMS